MYMYILLLLVLKNTHSFQSVNNIPGWFTIQYQQRKCERQMGLSINVYIYLTKSPYSLPMCVHTTWNPLTINPMGFPNHRV